MNTIYASHCHEYIVFAFPKYVQFMLVVNLINKAMDVEFGRSIKINKHNS
jgi:hypothetical protein